MGVTVNQARLAELLQLTPARISQLTSAGRLAGCFEGEGRARRYDPEKVAARLQGVLDPGQKLGNGAQTMRAAQAILSDAPPPAAKAPKTDGASAPGDSDSYQLLREQKLAEETKKLRRQNDLDAGTLVLASEVERQVAKVLRQEIAEVEEMLRRGARAVADRLGVDFRTVRQILNETWRAQRQTRSDVLAGQADTAQMTEAEQEADI